MLEQLQNYYELLDKEHKEHRNKYKDEKPGIQGFHYDRNKSVPEEERKRMSNIKEQKIHINRLIKLIKDNEVL